MLVEWLFNAVKWMRDLSFRTNTIVFVSWSPARRDDALAGQLRVSNPIRDL